jgi:hypothetical protein
MTFCSPILTTVSPSTSVTCFWRSAVRPTLGVIVAFVAMMAMVLGLSLGLWFTLGVDGVLLPGRFDGTVILNVCSVLAAVVGGLFAGWLCATISRSRTAIIVLAALCFLNGAGNAFAHWSKPDPGPREAGLTIMQAIEKRKEPAWFTLLIPFAGSCSVLLIGSRTLAVKAKRPDGPPAHAVAP